MGRQKGSRNTLIATMPSLESLSDERNERPKRTLSAAKCYTHHRSPLFHRVFTMTTYKWTAGDPDGVSPSDSLRQEHTSEPVSHTAKGEQNTTEVNQDTSAQMNTDEDMGDVTSAAGVENPAADEPSHARARRLAHEVPKRLQREKRWFGGVDKVRDEMMKKSKRKIPDKAERQIWVYSELDRMYPSLVKADNVRLPDDPKADNVRPVVSSDGQIQGLNSIPDEWPETMPANTSIGTEVAWVQANRLRIVKERPGKATLVYLDQAMSPAPSWAALGWLETSIRSYAKYVDVAAKVSGRGDEEGAVMRRERMAIEEMRGLLEEMREDER